MTESHNQEELNKALNIYRRAMCDFIFEYLRRKVRGETAEDLIRRIVNREPSNLEPKHISQIFSHRECRNLFKQRFGYSQLDDRDKYDIESVTALITMGRNIVYHHAGTTDLDSEFTRAYLFLIADILGKIDNPDAKREVEDIRNNLFSHNAAYKQNLADTTKQLEAANTEKIQYQKAFKAASNQLATLKRTNAQLEKRLETTSTQLKDVKAELAVCKTEVEKQNGKLVDPRPVPDFPYTGSQLRNYRKKAGLTQVAVALALGLSEGSAAAVGDWEADREKVPPKHYAKLKKLYGLEVLLGNGKAQKKKPSIAERYAAETTEEERNELAVKVAELRINEEGTRPLAWRKIREELGLKEDEFHQVIRPSAGYREAVVNRIKSLKARDKGWEYSGKLDVLTGIEIAESELK